MERQRTSLGTMAPGVVPKAASLHSGGKSHYPGGALYVPGKWSARPQKEPQLDEGVAAENTELAARGEASLCWMEPYGIGAGLQNPGNACYMNAALQCLTYTPPLANYLLSQEHSRTCQRRSELCTLCALESHFIWALHSPGHVIQPCQALAAGFHRNRQEDAHEFLLFALDALRAAGLPGLNCQLAPSEDQPLSHQLAGGHWRSRVTCLQCQGTSDTWDPYLDIVLDIQAAKNVQEALRHLVSPEELDGDNAYDCAACLRKTPASRTLTLHTCGDVLVLVLKRFSDFTRDKMAKPVHYPDRLDMRPYLSRQNGGPLEYRLYAVLVHVGLRRDRGHYLCYVKAGDGRWYEMDDAKVTACGLASALKQSAYVLFYVRKGGWDGANGQVSRGQGAPASGPRERHDARTPAEPAKPSDPEAEQGRQHLEQRMQELSLDEWKSLQEQQRPKGSFNLRRVEPSLPSKAVLIHQARPSVQPTSHPAPHERSWQCSSAGQPTHQLPENASQLPGLASRGRARAPKRKNKQAKRPLLRF